MKWTRTLAVAALFASGLGAQTMGCSKDSTAAPAPAPDDSARHTSWRRTRLLIEGAADRRARIFDVEDEEVTETLNLGEVTRLEASETGNLGIVHLAGANDVALVTSGVAIIDHVDHIHIYKSQPKLLAPRLSAGAALRIVSHDGYLGLFREDQATAAASTVREESLLGTDAGIAEMPLGEVAHHLGVVVPVRGAVLVTQPPAIELRSMAGALEQNLGECAFAGGIATARAHVSFTCGADLLRVAFAGDAGPPSASRIAYPAGLAAPPKVLQTHFERGVSIAQTGPGQLLRIGEQGEASIVNLPSDACSVALEPSRGERILVLASNGALHDMNFATGEITKSVQVLDPFICAPGAPYPHMALAPERAYITSPATGELVDVDLRGLRIAAHFPIDGTPNAIVSLGLDVRNMNVAPGAAHDGFK